MEGFDIDIVYHLQKWHGIIDGMTRAYEEVGDVSEDDNFQDVAIMTINAKKMPKEPQRQCEHKLCTKVEITW